MSSALQHATYVKAVNQTVSVQYTFTHKKTLTTITCSTVGEPPPPHFPHLFPRVIAIGDCNCLPASYSSTYVGTEYDQYRRTITGWNRVLQYNSLTESMRIPAVVNFGILAVIVLRQLSATWTKKRN